MLTCLRRAVAKLKCKALYDLESVACTQTQIKLIYAQAGAGEEDKPVITPAK